MTSPVTPESGPAGETAVILRDVITLYEVAGMPPKATYVAPVKLSPMIVTVVPPSVVPEVGLMLPTRGWSVKVNLSLGFLALVPPGLVTVTSRVAVLMADVTVVIEVSLLIVKLTAASLPNFTAVAPVNPVPLMVMVIPWGPEVGERPATRAAYRKP